MTLDFDNFKNSIGDFCQIYGVLSNLLILFVNLKLFQLKFVLTLTAVVGPRVSNPHAKTF